MAEYYTGITVRLEAAFTNFAGSAADPTTVICYYKDPTGTAGNSTYASSGTGGWLKTATGSYSFDKEVTVAGTWIYAFDGAGAVDIYGTRTFEVRTRPAG